MDSAPDPKILTDVEYRWINAIRKELAERMRHDYDPGLVAIPIPVSFTPVHIDYFPETTAFAKPRSLPDDLKYIKELEKSDAELRRMLGEVYRHTQEAYGKYNQTVGTMLAIVDRINPAEFQDQVQMLKDQIQDLKDLLELKDIE